MHTQSKIQHPSVQNIARVAELLQNHAAACASGITQGALHIIHTSEPGSPHPHPELSYPHLFHQLLFCFHGSCTLTYNGGRVSLEPGSIAACAPLTHYALHPAPGSKPRLLSIFELGNRWTCFTEQQYNCGTCTVAAMATARNNCEERTHFEQLLAPDTPAGTFTDQRAALQALVAAYTAALHREKEYRGRNRLHEAGTDEKKRMAGAVRLMIRRFPADITMAELADTCSITPDHFGKLFKKVFGIPPKEWMTHYRIFRAIDLMRGHGALSRISEQTGFGDQYYFSKAFKQHTGYAPSVYRKRFLHG